MIDDGVWGPLYGLQLASCYQSSPVQAFGLGRNGFSPNRNCWGPLLRRKRNAPGGMGGTRLGNWGPAEFGWVARGSGAGGPAEFGWVARSFGVGARGVWMGGTRLWSWGPRSLDGWHAALELGARGVWMAGTRLRSWGVRGVGGGVWMAGTRLGTCWGPAEFGWLARNSGAGGSRSLDGWHAAQELGPRFWMVAHGSGAGGPAELGSVARG